MQLVRKLLCTITGGALCADDDGNKRKLLRDARDSYIMLVSGLGLEPVRKRCQPCQPFHHASHCLPDPLLKWHIRRQALRHWPALHTQHVSLTEQRMLKHSPFKQGM
jgi:hypothetical protein